MTPAPRISSRTGRGSAWSPARPRPTRRPSSRCGATPRREPSPSARARGSRATARTATRPTAWRAPPASRCGRATPRRSTSASASRRSPPAPPPAAVNTTSSPANRTIQSWSIESSRPRRGSPCPRSAAASSTPRAWRSSANGSAKCPARAPDSKSGDINGFDVGELANAERAQFAAEAGLFDAAERQARIGGHHGVDERLAGLDLVDEAVLLGGVGGPDARAEAVGRVVGDRDRLVERADAEQERHRPEDLLAANRRTRRKIRERGGRVIKARPVDRAAADEQARAVVDRALDLARELGAAALGRQRPDVGVGARRIADLESPQALDEAPL